MLLFPIYLTFMIKKQQEYKFSYVFLFYYFTVTLTFNLEPLKQYGSSISYF